MIIKPSDLLKGSIIEWDGIWYIKYTDTLFIMYHPRGGNPFIVSDDPENTPMQRWNMSVLPSDRYFCTAEAGSVPRVISMPVEVTVNVAETLASMSFGIAHSPETVIHYAHYEVRRERAQANKEGTRPASPSADEGQPGEA